MSYRLHPDAAQEHLQQVAYYEREQQGLGRKYHAEFTAAMILVCEAPASPASDSFA